MAGGVTLVASTKTICIHLCMFGGALLISADAAQPLIIDEKLVAEGKIDIRPDYPAEAQAQGLTGAGVFVLHVDPKSGRVSSIEVEKSTGHKILDNASIAAFTDLRFKPHTVLRVKIPVTFTMPGDGRGPRVVRNVPAIWLAEPGQPRVLSGHSFGARK